MEKHLIIEKSFRHIFNVVNYLPISPQWNKIKLEYISKYRKNAKQERFSILNEFEKTLTHCPTCCVAFTDNTRLVRILPAQKKRFARRLLKKADNNKPLTKFQSKYFKKMDKHLGNRMIIKCTVCNNEVTKKLTKPPKNTKLKKEVCTVIPKNKKKRRRDRFSGLNQEAVLSINPVSTNSERKQVNIMPAGMKNSIKNKIMERKKETLKQNKKKAKTNTLLSKLSATLSKNTNTSTSSLSSFLKSL